MLLKFNKTYILLFISILVIEVLIATFLIDGFIRYTFGDYLVVILLYCFLKSFINASSFYIAISVLLFAYGIEFLQLINLLEILSLDNNHLAKLILGSTFHISDLVAYTLGILTVLIIEYKIYKLWIT
ncbi:ribosomal maturation YjgA family protein [Confluentibacter citreus]|uniref:ribosomal maturation YjgA family protein n=1 Tax=Confluentibacter citreus TaxID=2007307 RepID=UPI000C28FAEE|nr:DUF2809 domain-containing protein [Confluentibacter citreus]